MANLDFFCMCLNHLGDRFPNRGLDQVALNRLILAVQEVEAAYESLPLIDEANQDGPQHDASGNGAAGAA